MVSIKKILPACLILASLPVFAADYFPLDPGNAWTFSYVSTKMVIVPNPPVTRDSGTVRCEIIRKFGRDDPLIAVMLRTRSLVRSAITGGVVGNLDTTYSPPRVSTDTVFIDEHGNRLNFSGDTCAFAVHDPAGPLPVELSFKDTIVQISGGPVSGKKTIPSNCSCLNNTSVSFVLADGIGPVEAYFTWCPGMAGTSYNETWKLLSREYPTAVKIDPVSSGKIESIAVTQSSGRVVCKLLSCPDRNEAISAVVFDMSGRGIGGISTGRADQVVWDPESTPPGMYIIQVIVGNRMYTRKICLDR